MTEWEALHGEGILVCCPRCGRDAVITEQDWESTLACSHCGYCRRRALKQDLYAADGACTACYHRLHRTAPEEGKPPAVLQVKCGRCGLVQLVPVKKCGYKRRDPLAGLTLYLKASCRGYPVWAFNRRHLTAFMEYVASKEREGNYPLPLSLKRAKNRAGLLRLLKRMRDG